MFQIIFHNSRNRLSSPNKLKNVSKLLKGFEENRNSINLKFNANKLIHFMPPKACNYINSNQIQKLKDEEESLSKAEIEIDPGNFMYDPKKKYSKKNVLAPPSSPEEVDIIAPQIKPTFNIAAYVDKSETLKHFIHLGVEIAKWEKHKSICFHILQRNFEEDIKPYIFLFHDLGIPIDKLGRWLTMNPFVFKEALENIEARFNYLESKKFQKEDIVNILIRAPKWINYSTIAIDRELGIYQRRFNLSNREVRHVAIRDPKLVLYTIDNGFSLQRLRDEFDLRMGFTPQEQKQLLLGAPRLYRTNIISLQNRFGVIHNDMELSHSTMAEFPKLLLMRENRLSERHAFLKFLGKSQYDPSKPSYVSPEDFLSGTDAEFSVHIATSSSHVFNDFLKTL